MIIMLMMVTMIEGMVIRIGLREMMMVRRIRNNQLLLFINCYL